MIQKFKDIHEGKTIAILGSSESLALYKGEEDIAIALNGGVMTDYKVDYFMSYDRRCKNHEYYTAKPEIPRIIGATLAVQDKLLYDEIRNVSYRSDPWLDNNPPKAPHTFFYYEWYKSPPIFTKEKNILSHKGSIAHPAFELAWMMGANKIHIYGVEMGEGQYLKMADFMNSLITQAQNSGVEVFRAYNEKSSLRACKWLI